MKRQKQSGLAIKSAHRVKFEVEWAQHNLGKEFEANPISFNQMRLAHFMMGETEIILRSQNPSEMRAHLKLMRKLAYWQLKYDWASALNIYAAILRGIETGWETWNFNTRDYEDMLIGLNPTKQNKSEPYGPKKAPRDVFFCSDYQQGECQLAAPHQAKVGLDGAEKTVHHVCSSCLLKDGKKLGHLKGGPGCPRARV